MKETLDQIGILHGTDKATVFTRTYAKPHGYLPVMEKFFEPLRDQEIKLVEIGAAGGESIRTWLDYFEKAKVIGVDIVQATNPYNTVNSGVHPRYTFCQGDQSDEVFWKCFVASYGGDWNIVIDDGSHYSKDIITTFNALWPYVVPGGFYAIEDLGVAYGGPPFCTPGWPNHMEFIKQLCDSINHQELGIERLHFSRELAIIQKTNPEIR